MRSDDFHDICQSGAETYFQHNKQMEAKRDAVFTPKNKHDMANKKKKVAVIKPFQKTMSSRRRSIEWSQAIKGGSHSLISQSATQHRRVNISVQNITDNKEASHKNLPQIVSDHFSCQTSHCNCLYISTYSVQAEVAKTLRNKQKKPFPQPYQHLTYLVIIFSINITCSLF
jgi:hypothetical protein